MHTNNNNNDNTKFIKHHNAVRRLQRHYAFKTQVKTASSTHKMTAIPVHYSTDEHL